MRFAGVTVGGSRRTGVLVAVLAATVSALAFGTTNVSQATPAPTPLTIGAVFSLTGGGDVYGPQQLKGAQLAVRQLNAQGGIDGHRLRLAVRDDASLPAVGKIAMGSVIQRDGALAVLGPSLSLVAVTADPLADRLQTPVVAVSNTANGIVGDCSYACTWVWRDSLGESTAVPANIAEYVHERHPPSAAVVYVSGDKLGIDEGRLANSSFVENGVRVVANLAVPATGDVTATVDDAVAKKPDVLFIGASFGQQAVDVMKAARAAGFHGTFLGGNTLNSEVTAKLAGRVGAGARSGAAWYEGNDFPANRDFITAYRQAFDEQPDQFAAQAYIGVQIVADALERGKVATSTKSLPARRAALQKALRNVALMTPLGPFRFTAQHDVAQIVWVLTMTADGGHTLAGFCDPTC